MRSEENGARVSERRVSYELLSVYQDWLLARAGGFFAFGRPMDFVLPWAIPIDQCGCIEEVIDHLECQKAIPYGTPDQKRMAKQFLQVLRELKIQEVKRIC